MLGPDRFAPRLSEVSLEELEAVGIRGLILDLDNTVVSWGGSEIAEEHLAWVRRARDRGLRLVMLSNNFSDRVTSIARQMDIPFVANALKPSPIGFVQALRALRLPRRQVAVVGDQLFTDVLGGKLCGLYTILTEPLEARDHPITNVFRFFERLMLPQRRTP
ncbi:MAG TPA: YqeG family HAD IIIA-type phosphatase [Candidatus Tyrphobacter sp.]